MPKHIEKRTRQVFDEDEIAKLLGFDDDEVLVYAFVGPDGSLTIETRRTSTDGR